MQPRDLIACCDYGEAPPRLRVGPDDGLLMLASLLTVSAKGRQ